MGWLMGSRQRMQRTTLEPSGRVFMSGLPAGAEVPRTSFTVRSFSLLCENPEDSRSKESARRRAKGLALGRKKFWRGGRLPSAGSCTRKRAPIPLCGNAGGLMGGPPAASGTQDKDDAQYVPWAPVASENKPVARGAGKPRAAQGPPGQTGSPGLALGPATRSRLPGPSAFCLIPMPHGRSPDMSLFVLGALAEACIDSV
jgi:hypothetical protein